MNNFMPQSLEELYDVLAGMTPASRIIGGGTDFVMHLNAGRIEPDALIYLERVQETRMIEKTATHIIIGAGVTMNEMVGSEILKGTYESIIDAAGDVGSEQIRNSGTIGGNIANASPAGDLIPIMFMLDATLVIATPDKTLREVNIKDFILGPGKKALEYNEALIQIKVPVQTSPNYVSRFVKLGSRKKVTISRICVAMGLEIEEGIVKASTIYVGSISIKPVQLVDAEKLMIGRKIDEALKLEVAQILSDKIMEVTPEKFDRDYKVWSSKGAICDLLEKF